jgi:predicted PurR-regulated permease PerM
VLFGLPIAQGADWLEKRRIPRGIGVAVILTVFLGLLIGGGIGMAPILRAQSKELQQRLPEAMDKIDAWLGHRANGVLGILFNQESTGDDTGTVPGIAETDSVGIDTVPPPTIGPEAQKTIAHSNEVVVGGNLRREITRQFSGAQASFLRMLTSTFAVTGAFLLVLFIAAYIGVDPHLYHGGVLALVPSRERDRAALPLGILAGVAKFIPIVGSIFAAIPAIAMAFIDSPHKALVVAIGYIVIQFVENHLLVPVLMKHGVNLPPAMTLGIQALMALLFGFLGLLVAVPLLAAILTIVRTMNEKELREISEETSSRLPAGDEAIERAFDHRTGNYQ